MIADESAVREVLSRYKAAIERLDATGTEALFTEDSAVFETGGVEGTYSQYVAHHLGPELAAFRSFAFSDYTVAVRIEGDLALAVREELLGMIEGKFIPEDVVTWMRELPYFYEDEHAIYVHAGLVEKDGKWQHPSETENPTQLLWVRTMRFFQGYRGKRVVCGHTATENLPPELSSFTPEDPLDMWVGENVVVIDTGCGKGGFLTVLELPVMKVYESR